MSRKVRKKVRKIQNRKGSKKGRKQVNRKGRKKGRKLVNRKGRKKGRKLVNMKGRKKSLELLLGPQHLHPNGFLPLVRWLEEGVLASIQVAAGKHGS